MSDVNITDVLRKLKKEEATVHTWSSQASHDLVACALLNFGPGVTCLSSVSWLELI